MTWIVSSSKALPYCELPVTEIVPAQQVAQQIFVNFPRGSPLPRSLRLLLRQALYHTLSLQKRPMVSSLNCMSLDDLKP